VIGLLLLLLHRLPWVPLLVMLLMFGLLLLLLSMVARGQHWQRKMGV
jgi:hypothetical protein